MTDEHDHGAGRPNTAAEIVRQSMLRIAGLRRQMLRQLQRQGTVSAELQQEMQAAIAEYYVALRPYRGQESVREKWESVKLYQQAGEWVRGLDELNQWIHRTQTVEAEPRRRGASPETREVTEQMAPVMQLRVSSALDDIAVGLGLGMDVSDGPRPAALLEQQMADDSGDAAAATDGGEEQ